MFQSEYEAQELHDEYLSVGDARRCPFHPGEKTSSDDGMFDAPCGECEFAMSVAEAEWDCDPSNPHRPYCKALPFIIGVPQPYHTASCVPSEEDQIPF